MLTVVIKNFSTGTTWAGITHLPEIVRTTAWLVANTDNTLGRQPHVLGPDVIGLVVSFIDRHPQHVGG